MANEVGTYEMAVVGYNSFGPLFVRLNTKTGEMVCQQFGISEIYEDSSVKLREATEPPKNLLYTHSQVIFPSEKE